MDFEIENEIHTDVLVTSNKTYIRYHDIPNNQKSQIKHWFD